MKTTRRWAIAATMVAAVVLAGGGIGAAQPEPSSPTDTSATGTSATPTTTPFRTPDTESCPNRSVPPKPIDASEVPAPGQPSPAPLPVPDTPVGGAALGRCGTITPDGAPALPKDISATAWVLADLDTGQVLAAKDPHGRYRPASTIKTLLAIVALRDLDLSRVVTGTMADADADGTRVGIGPGGQYTGDQLMHALLMASGNDAANAIARQLGGVEATVAKMNAEAKALGATDTRTATPAGLDGPGMASSAYDLALFFRAAMRDPRFAAIIHTEQIDFPGFPRDPRIPIDTADPEDPANKDRPGFPIGNDNQLLYNYPGALGGKTGYTDDARQTFVAGAERNGRRLVVTLMAADVLPIRPWEQAARLLDYGFALDRSASVGELVGPGTTPAPAPPARLTQVAGTMTGTPPATVTAAQSVPAAREQTHWTVRVALLIGAALVVVLLLLAASLLHQRRR